MPKQTATADLTFAIVPEWLIDLDVSDRAFRLYALLARFADSDGTNAIPGRKRLAERLRCSIDSIDRAIAELIAAGAILREHRYRDGRQTSNDYVVLRIPEGRTDAADGGRTDAADPGRTDAAPETESQDDREPEDQQSPSTGVDSEDDVGFEDAWTLFPKRNGKRVGKQAARLKWRKLSLEDRRACWVAIGHYRNACDSGQTIAKDMERFLKADYWRDWTDGPGQPSTNGVRSGQRRATVSDWSGRDGGEF